jgi:hypothetical protein
MRIIEKVFHSLVNTALDRYGESQLDRSKRNLLSTRIELCMKCEVIGNKSKGIQSQWKLRWTKEHFMEKPSLTGSTSQKILSNMSYLIKVAFNEEMDEDSLNQESTRALNVARLEKWSTMCCNIARLFQLIEQRHDFTDDDIDRLHIMCNRFMCQWMDLLGSDHMTNYLHIIGFGHLTFFATKYRNLYRYSQQGWESLNQLLKHYYFNNTNHGGAAGNGGKSNTGMYTNGVISGDHCRPLMLLCQRSIMWKLGIGTKYFEENDTIEKNNSLNVMDEIELETADENLKSEPEDQSDSLMYGIL